MSRPEAAFYKPDTPEPGFMECVSCTVIWESDVDECGQFAVVFQESDGSIWAAHGDMESHSLFFQAVCIYRKEAC